MALTPIKSDEKHRLRAELAQALRVMREQLNLFLNLKKEAQASYERALKEKGWFRKVKPHWTHAENWQSVEGYIFRRRCRALADEIEEAQELHDFMLGRMEVLLSIEEVQFIQRIINRTRKIDVEPYFNPEWKP